MRAILNDQHTQPRTQRNQSLHIAQMPAHMAQHQHLSARRPRLRLQIAKIQNQLIRHLDKHRTRPHARYRPRHRGQRKGIGQHRLACLHTHRPQRTAQRIATRGHRKAILRPHQAGELLLQQSRLRDLARRGIIAVQPPMPQHRQRRLYPRLGDRLLLGKTAVKPFLNHNRFSSRGTITTNITSVKAIPAPATKNATSGDCQPSGPIK